MNVPLIECRSVTKRFGDVLAVDDVSFQLMRGEVLSILGASGCGKTTLLRLIAGFETLDAGQLRLQPDLVSDTTHHLPPERRNIGMVFQEYALFPHLTVAQNVAFGLHALSKGEQRERTRDALELVRLNSLGARYPHELSGGQQQRVALARTLAPSPIAVLLDEPFSNLDAGMRQDVRQEVEAILRSKGIAAIFVTHDRAEAFAFADRVGVMSDGRLEQVDEPGELYRAPLSPDVARIVGDCDFLTGVARGALADTELGMLPYRYEGGLLPDHAEIVLMVRPQDLAVEPSDTGVCAVAGLEYRGGETLLTVRLPQGGTLRCRQFGYSDLKKGARVTLNPREPTPFLSFVKPCP